MFVRGVMGVVSWNGISELGIEYMMEQIDSGSLTPPSTNGLALSLNHRTITSSRFQHTVLHNTATQTNAISLNHP